jgi:ectoine hydroxylase-related dioxygenase (phytanoyl-CoA dioxygenase family)
MDPSCLEHALQPHEKQFFNEHGYLIVEDALQPQQITALTQATDALHSRHLQNGGDGAASWFHPNFIPDDPGFVGLVDYPKILPKVWGILGWNIFLYHAHLIVTPPSGQDAPPEHEQKTFGWHQDSGRVNQEIECSPRPRLSLKVAYFLSDTSEVGRGNFWIVPGSQNDDVLERSANGIGQPAGAIPVRARPGTAVFFDRRLWHAASPNWSTHTRKVLFYGYGYRWLKPRTT